MKNNGFTLLELSIVIVIIGLIVAGISAGQSLVQQANLRKYPSDFKNFEVALNSFILQYDALPGDMDNASSYWSGAPDGNGDGSVLDGGSGATICATHIEPCGFVEHLVRANLLDFNGIGMTSITDSIPAPIRGYYFFGAQGAFYNKGSTPLAGTVITGSTGGSGRIWDDETLTPAEASSIDTKIDDGKPNTGQFVSISPGFDLDNCAIRSDTSATISAAYQGSAALYDLDETDTNCLPFYYYK